MNILKKLFKKEKKIHLNGEKIYLDGDKFVLMKEDYEGEVKKLFEYIEKNKRDKDYKGTLREALRLLNKENFEKYKCKSFMVGIKIKDRFYIAHAGRNRFYLYRDNELSLITTDDTEAFNLFNNGLISYEDTINHRLSEIMKKGMGLKEELELNIYDFYVKEKDVLCFVNHDFLINTTDGELEEILVNKSYKNKNIGTGSYIIYEM